MVGRAKAGAGRERRERERLWNFSPAGKMPTADTVAVVVRAVMVFGLFWLGLVAHAETKIPHGHPPLPCNEGGCSLGGNSLS